VTIPHGIFIRFLTALIFIQKKKFPPFFLLVFWKMKIFLSKKILAGKKLLCKMFFNLAKIMKKESINGRGQKVGGASENFITQRKCAQVPSCERT
jgi:hypothetical protein